MKISRVEAPRCAGGEGPLWDQAGQALFYLDNTGQKIHRFDPATGASRSWDLPSVITAMALRKTGGMAVALRTGIHALDFETGALALWEPLANPPPIVFNDGKADAKGRFIIGACTPHFDKPTPDGGLYSFSADHRLTKLDQGIHFSNSPCFSPDGKTLYFSDSFLYETYAYDYDVETGAVAKKRIFVNTRELGGMPDGATVDADGLVWMAIYGAGKIAAFRPDGKLERLIDMPTHIVSATMFGGPGLDQLYVTSLQHGALGEAPEETAGYLYVVEGLGARGLAEPVYAG